MRFEFRGLLLPLYTGLCLALIAGCSDAPQTYGAEVLGYNHTTQPIAAFTINGAYMGRSPANGQSGAVCCVKIPTRWRSGLKVEVSWTKDDQSNEFWKTEVIEIPSYSAAGHLAVHFFSDSDVRVIVTDVYVGHEKYPFPSPFERNSR